MSKAVAVVWIVIALPVIVGVYFFTRQNTTPVQASQSETPLVTTDTNIAYPDNSELLTSTVR